MYCRILRLIQQNRERIKGFGVKRIGLFGSYLRGEQKEGSDLKRVRRLLYMELMIRLWHVRRELGEPFRKKFNDILEEIESMNYV
uniref:Polymerase nucleotidyl transferase domain-containing protein n=1 Tax=Geoglobus ahangari TaxID=113653 RepID=A0A7C3YGR6_9EURY